MTDHARPLSYRARQQRFRRQAYWETWYKLRRGLKWALIFTAPFWLGVGYFVWRHFDG